LTGDRGRCRNAGEERPLLGPIGSIRQLGGIKARLRHRIAAPGHRQPGRYDTGSSMLSRVVVVVGHAHHPSHKEYRA